MLMGLQKKGKIARSSQKCRLQSFDQDLEITRTKKKKKKKTTTKALHDLLPFLPMVSVSLILYAVEYTILT